MHLPNSRLLIPELQWCVHNALTTCKRSMLPEQLSPAKSSRLLSMADKQYFQKISVISYHKMSTCFRSRGICVSMSYDEEWRQLSWTVPKPEFKQHVESYSTRVCCTKCMLRCVSEVAATFESLWSSNQAIHCALQYGLRNGPQRLVASLLLPKEPPNSQNPLNHWVSRWILPFCLLRPALGWMQMINFQHFHAFLAEKMLFPARKMGVNPCNVAMRWSEPQFFVICVILGKNVVYKRDRQMIPGI